MSVFILRYKSNPAFDVFGVFSGASDNEGALLYPRKCTKIVVIR